MTAITLPDGFKAWAQGEVDSGRAHSIEDLALDALAERAERGRDVAALIEHARTQAAEGKVRPGPEIVANLRTRAAALRARAEIEE